MPTTAKACRWYCLDKEIRRFSAPGQGSQLRSHGKGKRRGAAANHPRLRCEGGRLIREQVVQPGVISQQQNLKRSFFPSNFSLLGAGGTDSAPGRQHTLRAGPHNGPGTRVTESTLSFVSFPGFEQHPMAPGGFCFRNKATSWLLCAVFFLILLLEVMLGCPGSIMRLVQCMVLVAPQVMGFTLAGSTRRYFCSFSPTSGSSRKLDVCCSLGAALPAGRQGGGIKQPQQ